MISQRYGRPVAVCTRSFSATPTVCCSATSRPTAPANATRAAVSPTILSERGAPPKRPSPTTAAPRSSIDPAYRAVFAETARGVGPEVPAAGASPGEMVPWTAPTPKANTPAVSWPSCLDTTCQLTVYTPSGMWAGSDTVSVRGGCRVGGPAESFVPPDPKTRIVDSAGSGDSVKVRRISLGAFGSDVPLAGSDDARFA